MTARSTSRWVAASFALVNAFTGNVASVTDGDSITSLCERDQVQVRLVGAPEKAQVFGNRSKRALAALVHGREGPWWPRTATSAF